MKPLESFRIMVNDERLCGISSVEQGVVAVLTEPGTLQVKI